MKKVWCVELVTSQHLYVRYFNTEREARQDSNRVFQLYAMPDVFQTEIPVSD